MTRNNDIKTMMKPIRLCLTGILFIISQAAVAQTATGIVIGGDVYGGGRQGAVGTAKTDNPDAETSAVTLKADALSGTTTNIVINSGQVRTVFGGGQNGRTFGTTSVTVKGGTVGDAQWNGSIHGGIFGAGDGQSAVVYGGSNVTMQGGTVIQNIYGGGNEAALIGTTAVTLKGGDIQSTVYGGARVADINGYTLLHIDGADAKNDLIIKAGYGGNDIAGNISIPEEGSHWSWIRGLSAPNVCTDAGTNGVNGTWNAFVVSTPSTDNPDDNNDAEHTVYVGQLFGGGNGDYTYDGTDGAWTMSQLKQWDSQNNTWNANNYTFDDITRKPEVRNVYLELKGGIFGYVYGGGNKATVTNKTVICLNNTTEVDDNNKNLYKFSKDGLRAIGINLDVDKLAYDQDQADEDYVYPHYQFDRVFGGNKQADMAIQPDWKLIKGDINSLYSGGDAGNMTYSEGLLLAITSQYITANNVYGGCRIADVAPTGSNIAEKQFNVNNVSYTFPAGLSARVLITNGTINNVYGGNDISGTVFGGSALEILHSINGEVYGGGNGSYVYTDNSALQNDATYGDFYYNPGSSSSIDALNAFRPNTSKTYIHLAGTETKPITVRTVYGGGNSTTVSDNIRLRLGTYVTVDNIYLGSNGINMKSEETLQTFAGSHDGKDISTLNFKDGNGTFDKFMLGTAVSSQPALEFDNSYPTDKTDPGLANVGSFYCGGNVGSMTSANMFNINFTKPIVITNKIVGGCNTAYVEAGTYNDLHQGGFIGGSNTNDKITLNIDGVVFTTTPQTTATAGNQGNIFGGCFESGKMVGNVKINLKENIIPSTYFASTEARDTYLTDATKLFSTPLSVFGGGYGENALVDGNTTVSVFDGSGNASGAALKVFGGGYGGTVQGNTTVNIYGEDSFIGRVYGGGFEGPVIGSTTVNLDGGTVLASFGGSCNANITGYAQTYLGAGLRVPQGATAGMTTVMGSVYGGNDFGGQITGTNDFSGRVSSNATSKVYNPNGATTPNVVQASAYVEYQQGKITDYIFGGNCGSYDYTALSHEHTDPYLVGSFVNLRPLDKAANTVQKVFGAGQGYSGTTEQANHQDQMQDRSYVLVDIPSNQTNFEQTDIFGSGAYSGLGMRLTADEAKTNLESVTAVVDLVSGTINNAYGASFNEGVTRRTVVNVPHGSTSILGNLFGGGYGSLMSSPCDAIETNVNWSSSDAVVTGSIFGGNNNCRRSLFSTVNINSKARASLTDPYTATIYGGGLGANTWSYYTVVNLNANTEVYQVYGGGKQGNVLNKESFAAWKTQYDTEHSSAKLYNVLGSDYDTDAGMTALENQLVHANPLDTVTNTNVYIWKDSYMSGYAYGGGQDSHVSGATYIGLHGGYIKNDMYAAGESGDVCDLYKTKSFTPTANAFVEGGKVRRVYGGGWKGNVGSTNLPFTVSNDTLSNNTLLASILENDILGVTNVVIGIDESEASLRHMGSDYNYYKGIPTVEWNAYGGGERGGIIGTTNLTVYNGYIGYRYFEDAKDDTATVINEKYKEKVDDETADDGVGRNYLIEHGNLFGGGYDDGSYSDYTNVRVYGGFIRNSVYGGGEIAAVGRGQTAESGQSNTIRQLKGIAKAGWTNVEIYGGNIHRSVFGGGKGYSATRANDYAYSATRRYTDGYVFGQTAAKIYGGIIGTPTTLLEGEGNVFGGGNIGYVYTKVGKKWNKTTDPNTNITTGDDYYYKVKTDGTWDLSASNEKQFTEDCKVVVSPYCRVLDNQEIEIAGHTYKGAYLENGVFHHADYVPTSALNTISNKNNMDSTKMDTKSGIIISNAVFAGGNVSQGSDLLYAEAKTVFGNATASIIDLYCMDLITLGQEGIGGLYGDGNLTFVDGYRELNITNYGTDYYGLMSEISYELYLKLNDRERAYFQLEYRCKTAVLTYNVNDKITSDEYNSLTPEDQACFEVTGVCSIYAGRMMNTIQRADYCGVFGSRMVMRGARDRVPAEVDYTNYTINRVGEVALHERKVNGDSHGNYFGIYNIVNYLGALTSDVEFMKDKWRSLKEVSENTYYAYKNGLEGKRSRNNGASHNEVALASGVYLELLQEPNRNYVGDEKIYGPITGVVQLNLIAAATGEGGGYVYAKNIHGGQSKDENLKHLTLAPANAGGITHRAYSYNSTTTWMQSSGNFVSADKTIIDECFPTVNSYEEGGSEAHYWFIKGDFYVYNQEISAYTGSAQSYIKNVSIPLTILAQGNGRIKIEDIKTNLYADATKFPEGEESVMLNGITYYSNDPITWWDYYNLSTEDQKYFTYDSYVCVNDIWTSADSVEQGANPKYAKGTVFSTTEYKNLTGTWYNNKGDEVEKGRAFRHTNALNHNNGYMLAVSLDQPGIWDEHYTSISSSADTMGVARYNAQHQPAGYKLAPTFKLTGSEGQIFIFGQSEYKTGDLVEQSVFDGYQALNAAVRESLSDQASLEPAYMAMTTCDITVGTKTYHVVERSAIPQSRYDSIQDATQKSYFAKAFIALETIKLTDKLLLSSDQLYSFNELNDYSTQYPTIIPSEGDGTNKTFTGFQRAYYFTEGGSYGGTEFSTGQNYQAMMYANLNPDERENFVFNYDALDIMLDTMYRGDISYYDKPGSTLYHETQKIDYRAKYKGANGVTLLGYGTGTSLSPDSGAIYSRDVFESLANEKRHYSRITTNVSNFENNKLTLYIVSEEFGRAGRIFCQGEQIDATDYAKLSDAQKGNINTLELTKNDNSYSCVYKKPNGDTVSSATLSDGSNGELSFYLCTEAYTKPGETNEIRKNTLINQSTFNALVNYQKDFEVIAGIPEEKSALYVSRDCDIYDFTGDRIFTIIYRYNYTEPDDDGEVYRSVSERHILNIRVHFESGEPIIGELIAPAKMLPGTIIGLTKPSVQKGAFEVLGGGWELYENENNALTHKNGVPYANYVTPMYWYQDNWYVAYYAETYLGRTFSNPVPFSIANYHDLDDVMADTTNHMHIDHPGVKSNSKIYIDNRNTESDDSKSELDLLYDLFDLSLRGHGTKDLLDEEGHIVYDSNNQPIQVDDYDIDYDRGGELNAKHSALNDHVRGLDNLDFILNNDVEPKAYTTWTPIGTDAACFNGTLHGNGYTISGIDKSLFGNLCDSVFNLGIRGIIAGSGIADKGGYAQNCWLINDATTDLSTYTAMMGTGIIVNGYYNDEAASNHYGTKTGAESKPMGSFLNGEVAFNLNGFYLNKRYKDHLNNNTGRVYHYYTVGENNTLSQPIEGHASDNILYVERYYKDGQFVYAGGTIPSGNNIRYAEKDNKHYPIYPDDYIYFGQKLTYDMTGAAAHDIQPEAVYKSGGFIDNNATGNRVFRAPAYYGSSTMGKAYFNSFARFADTYTYQGNDVDVYAGMTAIDFTGNNDATWTDGANQANFFKPLLDYSGLKGFDVKGLTKNLLVYVDYTNDGSSYTVLDRVLLEPAFNKTNSTYATVSPITQAEYNSIKGHLVKKVGSDYQANGRQFLVDLEDFNAPIGYKFGESDFMWYQRKPGVYVESMEGGWETVSLPFKTELVTTQQKGEITHFYSGSTKGHEYGLREFKSVENGENQSKKAMFQSLAAGNVDKAVSNTFLWDHYYNGSNHRDVNSDSYIAANLTEYDGNRTYTGYPLAAAGTPYLIGFPGSRYYEFDLSGQFEAQHTDNPKPAKLNQQIITFASVNGQVIGVTDTEYTDGEVTQNGYTFHPIYQAKAVDNAYMLKADGTADDGKSFNLQASGTTVPFRTYMTASPTNPAPRRSGTSTDVLYIGYTGDNDQLEETVTSRGLNIYAEHMNIVIESTMDVPANVTITTTAGRTLKQISVQPGTKVTVPVNSRGIYIVNRQKVAVTR